MPVGLFLAGSGDAQIREEDAGGPGLRETMPQGRQPRTFRRPGHGPPARGGLLALLPQKCSQPLAGRIESSLRVQSEGRGRGRREPRPRRLVHGRQEETQQPQPKA